MPLFYKGIQTSKANKAGVKTWHPSLVKMKKRINTQTLAEEIAEKASLTPGDVQNVVRNLLSVMRRYLLDCYTVRLEGLGTFTMKVRSQGKKESSRRFYKKELTGSFFIFVCYQLLSGGTSAQRWKRLLNMK